MTKTTVTPTSSGQRLSALGTRFVGWSPAKIDAKGRVSVPTCFRRFLLNADGEAAADEMFVALPLVGTELWCGGPDLGDVMMDAAVNTVLDDAAADYGLQQSVFQDMERLAFDDTGRVTLPKWLREEADLAGPVIFGGQGAFFVLGDAERMAAARRARRQNVAAHREALMLRAAPSRTSRQRDGGADE